MHSIEHAAERIHWLAACPPADRAALLRDAEVRQLTGEGAAAPFVESPFVWVTDGTVKVALRDSGGRQTTLTLTTVGELLDGGLARSEDEGVVYLPLARSAELLLLNRSSVLQRAAHGEEVARAVTEMLLASYRTASDRIAELSVTPARRRIANLLHRLGERHGRRQADGRVMIDLRLSRQDIADLAATTLETAIRTVSGLNRLGVLEASTQGIVIARFEQLRRIGDGSEPVPKPAR